MISGTLQDDGARTFYLRDEKLPKHRSLWMLKSTQVVARCSPQKLEDVQERHMSTGSRVRTGLSAILLAVAVLLAGSVCRVEASPTQSHRKTKAKKQPLPPLPSGPTGPVQQIPLDSIAAVPPQVSYQNNELTIVAPNSTLADVLRAVRKQTGAEIEVPQATERVVTRLGPGPARDVLSDLLNGSRFNYVLLGAPGNDSILTRVVLVPKSGQPQQPTPAVAANPAAPQENQPPAAEAENTPAPEQDASSEGTDSEASDDSANNGDDTGDQAAEADQQAPANPDQPGVKTPQQMLQEMQQRQLQLQQQQQTGQPVTPGSGMPPHPPQQQQQQ
jgi:hypothetical protein